MFNDSDQLTYEIIMSSSAVRSRYNRAGLGLKWRWLLAYKEVHVYICVFGFVFKIECNTSAPYNMTSRVYHYTEANL